MSRRRSCCLLLYSVFDTPPTRKRNFADAVSILKCLHFAFFLDLPCAFLGFGLPFFIFFRLHKQPSPIFGGPPMRKRNFADAVFMLKCFHFAFFLDLPCAFPGFGLPFFILFRLHKQPSSIFWGPPTRKLHLYLTHFCF